MPSGVMGDQDYVPLSAIGNNAAARLMRERNYQVPNFREKDGFSDLSGIDFNQPIQSPIRPVFPDDRLSMTHWPEQQNPAAPLIAAAKELNPFGGRGVSEIMKQRGVQLPDWSDTLGGILRSEAANTAMGMATPLKIVSGTMAGVNYTATVEQAAQLKAARRAGAGREEIQRMVNEFGGAVAPAASGAPDISGRIQKAFYELAGNPPRDAVRLNDLRAKLTDIPRDELDRTLLDMNKNQSAMLMPLDNPKDIRSVGESALQTGINTYHTLWLPRNSRNAASADILPRAAGPSYDLNRPINPQTVEEMRANPVSEPGIGGRPINDQTLREMRDLQNQPAPADETLGDIINRLSKPPSAATVTATPLKGFHGSPAEFNAVDLSKRQTTDTGYLGRGFYATTDPKATIKGANQYEVALNLKSPLNVALPDFQTDKRSVISNALGLPKDASSEQITRALRERGHDGVVLDYSPTGYNHQEMMALNPQDVQLISRNSRPIEP